MRQYIRRSKKLDNKGRRLIEHYSWGEYLCIIILEAIFSVIVWSTASILKLTYRICSFGLKWIGISCSFLAKKLWIAIVFLSKKMYGGLLLLFVYIQDSILHKRDGL